MQGIKKASLLLIISAVTAAIFFVSTGCGGGSKSSDQVLINPVVKWTGNSGWPSDNHQSAGLIEFARRAKVATDGRIEITVQVGGALGYKDSELIKAVQDGLVTVSDMMTSGVADAEPLFNIVTLPFLVQSLDEGKILNDTASPYFAEVIEHKWGQKILYFSPWPPSGIWSKKEITEISDLKGLNTRTYDNNGNLVMQALGATPFQLPFSEIYPSIVSGAIDSVMTSTPTAVDTKLWEVLNFYEPLNVMMATDLVSINLKEFYKLDTETQNILIKLGKDMEAEMWNKVAKLDKDKEEVCNKNGIKTITPSKQLLNDLAVITKNIRENWLKTAPLEASTIVDEFNRKVGR